MEENKTVELTDKQVLVDTLAKGVLAVVVATFVRMGVERAYDSVMTNRRSSTDTITTE